MRSPILLDTHIAVRWLMGGKGLSAEQVGLMDAVNARREKFLISAASLMELAIIMVGCNTRRDAPPPMLLRQMEESDDFEVVPLSFEVAHEIVGMGKVLQDPVDLAIVATARLHGVRLVTSDDAIIESGLVPVVF